jgi:hypothetical protein
MTQDLDVLSEQIASVTSTTTIAINAPTVQQELPLTVQETHVKVVLLTETVDSTSNSILHKTNVNFAQLVNAISLELEHAQFKLIITNAMLVDKSNWINKTATDVKLAKLDSS